MRAALALFCCLLVLPAGAEETTVYKRVRPDGTIEFSDTPVPGSQSVQVPQLPAYKPGPLPKPPSKQADAPPAELPYREITVTSPTRDSTLFFDEQGLPVTVAVEPALRQGDRVVIYLDGRRAALGTATAFTLKEVYRGSHTLAAAVEGADGKERLRSPSISFQMVQHTRR